MQLQAFTFTFVKLHGACALAQEKHELLNLVMTCLFNTTDALQPHCSASCGTVQLCSEDDCQEMGSRLTHGASLCAANTARSGHLQSHRSAQHCHCICDDFTFLSKSPCKACTLHTPKYRMHAAQHAMMSCYVATAVTVYFSIA